MNEQLTLQYVDKVLGRFKFSRRLMIWDSIEWHIINSVCANLRDMKLERAIVSVSYTKYIQAGDIYLKKPFKVETSYVIKLGQTTFFSIIKLVSREKREFYLLYYNAIFKGRVLFE